MPHRQRAAALPHLVPVAFTYWTAWVDEAGVLQLRDDLYGWDARLVAALTPPPLPRRAASGPLHRRSARSRRRTGRRPEVLRLVQAELVGLEHPDRALGCIRERVTDKGIGSRLD